jgi:agmatine deiminase
MAKRIEKTTPKNDGFRMPAEYEPQEKVWMIWPERPDNWRNGAKPAQKAFSEVAKAISKFTKMNVLVSREQFQNCRRQLPPEITVYEMSNNDAWVRDCGPTFLINDKGELRAADWKFNAWGGLVDGLYFPWDQDDLIAQKVCEIENVDSYRTSDFVLEGGSIHVDGEGTVLTTEMCLLSEGRNPHMTREEIEKKLCDYLNCEKVLWLKDGIDPEETNGHIDDVACFVAPGEVACIYTEDKDSPFYEAAQDAYRRLSEMTDAKGRKLKIHKICCPIKNVTIKGDFAIDYVEGTLPREDGDICIASYMNFLITNNGVIVPQYGDENDTLALKQIKEIFPDKEVVGVNTVEIVYGGGNIHCITQQQPKRTV